MIRTKKKASILPYIGGCVLSVVVVTAACLYFGKVSRESTPSTPEIPGDVYICSGCGKEYINQFPYTSPWEGYPTEFPPTYIKFVDIEGGISYDGSIEVVNIGRETSNNGSIDGATPVNMYQYVTGNLSSRDDVDFYRFTVDVSGGVGFLISVDGNSGGYTHLWDVVIYGTDDVTELWAWSGSIEDNKQAIMGISNLEPGKYYLKISFATDGNTFVNGYADSDYHICFLPACAEHTNVTTVLTATPTCSQTGELMTKCNTCDLIVSKETLEPLDHIWSKWKPVEENFISSIWGSYSRVCALCGEEETSTLWFHFLDEKPKLDPDAVTVTETWTEFGTASCASEGLVTTKCSVCGNVEVEREEATGHTYGEWMTSHVSTCSVEGKRSRICTICGYVETETLDCIPHVYGEKMRVSGSILNAPIVSQEICTECGHVNIVESGWSRWVLPAITILGVFTTAGLLLLTSRVIRRRRRRFSQKRSSSARKIKLFNKKFTCPFCMREYDKSDVLYFCPDCGKNSQPGRFEKNPIACKTHRCNGLATLRKCPFCGQIIPKTALETPNLPFSIIGVSNSGKTNYITVMLHELGKASGLRLILGHQTKETLDRQNENYHRIYEEHTKPESTQSGENTPQIWYIKNLMKKRGSKVPTYTFTIFDGAGEDHENSLDPSSTVCRYINVSKAIILAIDPLALPKIRKGGVVDHNVLVNSLGGYEGNAKNAQDVINNVATYIKAARGIKATTMLDIPVAVVLTKFDTLINHKGFGPQALIRNRSLTVRDGKVDTTEIKQVDQEIRNWLYQIGEGAFIDTLDSHFKEYCFFGVSSYGAPPKDAYTLSDEIRPHRVLDPILWLFKREKFID